jgi:hypothetical protein
MTSSIGYINNTMMQLTIYFHAHMHIDEKLQTSFLSGFIQDRSAYKHKYARIVFYIYFFPEQNT